MVAYKNSSEETLIKGCKNAERKAQRELYERFADALYAICLRYAKTTHDADDILQKSFLKIFDQIELLEETEALEAWMRRITVNTALNEYRSVLKDWNNREEVSEENYYEENNVALMQLSYQELLKMIGDLPEQCRIIFNLHAIEGYKHREIAEMLGLSTGTSKSQYARSRQLLQEMIVTEEQRYARQTTT